MELAATHEVLLATGRPRRVNPERILGRSIFWWMDKLGILRASREMRVGRHLMRTDPFPGKALGLGRLRRRGIRVVGRLSRVDGKRVGFAGERESAEVDAVIWATGYIGTIPTGWRSPRPRTSTGISFISAVSFRCLVSTSSDEAGSGRADLPCSPASAKTPRI